MEIILNLPETAGEFIKQYVGNIVDDMAPWEANSLIADYGRSGIINMVKEDFLGTKQMIHIFGDYSKVPEYFTPDIIDDMVDAVYAKYKSIAGEY